MAKRWETICYIRLFENSDGKGEATYSNSNWKPYSATQKAEADIFLRQGQRYQVSLFDNDNGTMSVRISAVHEYEAEDNIADAVSQSAMKPLANSINKKYQPAEKGQDDDPDIPF